MMFVSDCKNSGAGYEIAIELVTPNIRLSLNETITIYSTTNLEFSSRQFSVARWRVEAPDDTVMNIRFLEFDLAVSLEFFVVIDGLRPHNRERYRFEYEGNKLPPDIVSLSNRMNIIFAAYSDTLNGTFVINVTARTVQPGDLSPTYVPAGGTIYMTSPNYPGHYPNYFQRVWVVTAPKGYIIRFRFLDLRLPNDNDYLALGDGFYYLADGSHIISVGGPLTSGPPDRYYTETNALFLHFKSDPTDGNGGYKVEVSAITLPIVLDVNDVHILESPAYPMPYENNVFIEWNVQVQPGFGVLLRFIVFGMTDHGDILSIGKGTDSNDTNSVAARFTGDLASSDFVVWSERVWIRFTTDSSGIGDGFVIELRPIQGEGYCLIPLGMTSGWIPDGSLSATSRKDKEHSPSEARLHGTSSWIPDPEVDDSTIQVNFDQGHYITGILVQGGSVSVGTWVESLLVMFDDDSAEIIHGKWDPEAISIILFARPRLTRHIQITPRSKDPSLLSLRLEILGCQKGCHFDLGISSGILTSAWSQNTVNDSYSDFDSLRLLPYDHRPLTGWVGRSSSDPDSADVFIGTTTVVREIIIQQCANARLLSFNLAAMSDDASRTFHYNISDCDKAMCKAYLPEGIVATRYKILPTEWIDGLCFRLELLGCHAIECASRFCEENCSSAFLSPGVGRDIAMYQSRTFPPRAMCHQEISLPTGQYVVFIFHGFQPQTDGNGNADGVLSLTDSVDETEVSFDLNEVPSVFVSSSSNLLVTLLSGLLTGISRAVVAYGSVGKPGCSKSTDVASENSFSCKQSSGFLMSPGYFASYAPNLDLSWDIATKPWTQISLAFVELDVTSLEQSCDEDYVIVMDLSSQSSLGRFCDQKKPQGSVVSSLNRMEITFHSDSIGSGYGFIAEYSSSILIPDAVNTTKNHSCPDGWVVFKGSCYRLIISHEALTWNEAELVCQESLGGHLVSIRDEDEMIFLHYMISSQWEATETETYIGLGRRDERGIFHWTDGTPMSYTDWYSPPPGTGGAKQPDGGLLEACTMFVFDSATSTDLSTNLWHDVACASPETEQFICEIGMPGKTIIPVEVKTTVPTGGPVSNCGMALFQCSTGECINKVFSCDGTVDCRDGSDEDTCQEECSSDQFRCSDGSCISISFYCDSIPHCLDNSDESDCVLEVSPSAFQCYDGSLFPAKIQCDGVIDCIGNTNEDEHGCAYNTLDDACRSAANITCSNIACAPQATRCLYELDKYGFFTGCRDVTHLRDCGDFECPESYLKCPSSYCIPLRYRCNGRLDCPSGEDEANCGVDEYKCPDGSYQCHGQLFCISHDHVCDDVIHCPEQDDELFCEQCPGGCTCVGLSFSCHPDSVDFIVFPRQLRKLSLVCDVLADPCNASLTIVTNDDVTDGRGNSLVPLTMPYLITLSLESSSLEEIQLGAFQENKNLLDLNLAGNNVKSIFRGTFEGLHRIQTLNLSANPLSVVEAGAFGNLTLLQELDIRGTDIAVTTNIGHDMFLGLENLQIIHADRYVFCCLAGLVDSVGCNAPRDQFSSCEELMASEVLRIFIWILGGSAFIGNGFVFIYRVIHQKRDRKTIVQSSFITNLAVSDFMMGLYMITIASADIYFRGNYALHADAWQSSVLCKLAGMLSVVSSEASVLFIMMISVDRCIHVLLPFKKGLHLSPMAARCTQLIIWAIGVLVSVIPLMIPSYNQGNFYGQSGVCLALPLTVDRPAGWHYSISLFIGANFAAFLTTLLCYVAIYIRYRQSKRMISQTGKVSRDDKKLSEDIKLAWKMLLIVGTDLICWFPIIIMGLLSAAGKLVISAQVYAWTAVFVLPVNSSLNPYLYTLSTMHGKKQTSKKSGWSATEENKTMESGMWDGDGPSSKTKATTPFSIVPTMVAQFLEHWLINESRDLTLHELDVIRRDIGQSWDLLQKAGNANTMDGYFKNIIVQTDAANTIQRAFVVLDPPSFNVEHVEKDDQFNGRSNNPEANQTKVLEVLKGLSESRH
ncbi:uncharacterized protein LOC121429653 isoform X2 [Lytechinus variegatus]|uniref:uncharacterized protein LOC121429653 isoform X2 n=1 Tax=Lytechinus variegatus TaxID=7654 RepID=UPI001BB17A31|nr:uncharacterized protein LOC121429653 isoform X2 [Lytechinus variegatus]